MGVHFDLAKLSQRVNELDKLQEAEDFWNDTKKAQTIIKEANIDRNKKTEDRRVGKNF